MKKKNYYLFMTFGWMAGGAQAQPVSEPCNFSLRALASSAKLPRVGTGTQGESLNPLTLPKLPPLPHDTFTKTKASEPTDAQKKPKPTTPYPFVDGALKKIQYGDDLINTLLVFAAGSPELEKLSKGKTGRSVLGIGAAAAVARIILHHSLVDPSQQADALTVAELIAARMAIVVGIPYVAAQPIGKFTTQSLFPGAVKAAQEIGHNANELRKKIPLINKIPEKPFIEAAQKSQQAFSTLPGKARSMVQSLKLDQKGIPESTAKSIEEAVAHAVKNSPELAVKGLTAMLLIEVLNYWDEQAHRYIERQGTEANERVWQALRDWSDTELAALKQSKDSSANHSSSKDPLTQMIERMRRATAEGVNTLAKSQQHGAKNTREYWIGIEPKHTQQAQKISAMSPPSGPSKRLRFSDPELALKYYLTRPDITAVATWTNHDTQQRQMLYDDIRPISKDEFQGLIDVRDSIQRWLTTDESKQPLFGVYLKTPPNGNSSETQQQGIPAGQIFNKETLKRLDAAIEYFHKHPKNSWEKDRPALSLQRK